PNASIWEPALQRPAHGARFGRLAVGSAQELRSYGTPRSPSGDQPRRLYARGNAARRGPRARRDAMAGAHPRDGIPASGTMSSPSTGVGGGAAPSHALVHALARQLARSL